MLYISQLSNQVAERVDNIFRIIHVFVNYSFHRYASMLLLDKLMYPLGAQRRYHVPTHRLKCSWKAWHAGVSSTESDPVSGIAERVVEVAEHYKLNCLHVVMLSIQPFPDQNQPGMHVKCDRYKYVFPWAVDSSLGILNGLSNEKSTKSVMC